MKGSSVFYMLMACVSVILSLEACSRKMTTPFYVEPSRAQDGAHGSSEYFEDGEDGQDGERGGNGQDGGHGGNGGSSFYGHGGDGGDGGDAD